MKELRSHTADHMRSHTDDFLPFLTNPNTGDMYTTGISALVFCNTLPCHLVYIKVFMGVLVSR